MHMTFEFLYYTVKVTLVWHPCNTNAWLTYKRNSVCYQAKHKCTPSIAQHIHNPWIAKQSKAQLFTFYSCFVSAASIYSHSTMKAVKICNSKLPWDSDWHPPTHKIQQGLWENITRYFQLSAMWEFYHTEVPFPLFQAEFMCHMTRSSILKAYWAADYAKAGSLVEQLSCMQKVSDCMQKDLRLRPWRAATSLSWQYWPWWTNGLMQYKAVLIIWYKWIKGSSGLL